MFSYFFKLYTSIQYWKIHRKDIADISKLVKEFIYCSLMWGNSSSYFQQDHIQLGGNKPDEKRLWDGNMIERLLLTVTITDPQ